MSLRARYGGRPLSTGAQQSDYVPALQKIYDGTKEADNVSYDYITLEPESNYLLVRQAWTISNARFYGQGWVNITTPGALSFGAVAATATTFANTTNSGITLEFTADTQIRWRCANTTYRARVRVYKIV